MYKNLLKTKQETYTIKNEGKMLVTQGAMKGS